MSWCEFQYEKMWFVSNDLRMSVVLQITPAVSTLSTLSKSLTRRTGTVMLKFDSDDFLRRNRSLSTEGIFKWDDYMNSEWVFAEPIHLFHNVDRSLPNSNIIDSYKYGEDNWELKLNLGDSNNCKWNLQRDGTYISPALMTIWWRMAMKREQGR